jgi:hypothetical protein
MSSGMLLKFSSLFASKDEGSMESIYRRRSTKPLVEEVKNNFDHQASAPDHLNIIPEDLEELICDQDGKIQLCISIIYLETFLGSRMSLSAFRQVSCPEFEIRKHDFTRNIRKIHSMGS